MVLSLLDHVRRGYRGNNSGDRGRQEKARAGRPCRSANRKQIAPGLLVYLFSHSLYYANAGQFAEEILRLARNGTQPPLRWLCVEAAAIGDVDFSAAAMLRDTAALLHQKGIRLLFTNVSAPVRSQFDRYGVTDAIGVDAIYGSIHAVVVACEQQAGVLRETAADQAGDGSKA
jgi:SulP family sulfate permease